jgi:hypothetical protein
MSENEQTTLEKFGKYIHENNVSNEFLVQIIELSGRMLNLKTISDYAKYNGISYNGAKKFRNKIELFNTKFIIDND